jgi:hypothetical protein
VKIVIPQKAALNLLRSQLEPICESLPHEEQCGFWKLRGCIGAIFNVRLAVLTGVPPDPPFLLPFCLPTARVGGCDIFFEVTFLPFFNWRVGPRNF